MRSDAITLFRPVGDKELQLINKSGRKAFPPRLTEQPIFYPVLNEEYARQIARDWNAKYNESRVGYVTRFQVLESFISQYEVHCVGSSQHLEYWIPADDLDAFNLSIVGEIEIIAEFRDLD